MLLAVNQANIEILQKQIAQSNISTCPKSLLPENQYMERYDSNAKDASISICTVFEVSPDPQAIDFYLPFF